MCFRFLDINFPTSVLTNLRGSVKWTNLSHPNQTNLHTKAFPILSWKNNLLVPFERTAHQVSYISSKANFSSLFERTDNLPYLKFLIFTWKLNLLYFYTLGIKLFMFTNKISSYLFKLMTLTSLTTQSKHYNN